jgi:hypothetical protein
MYMKIKLAIFVLIAIVFSTGCAPAVQLPPPQTALQVREIQTRTFRQTDDRLVMKAVLNALQDQGYIAKNAVVELGLLTAVKEANDENQTDMILSSLLMGKEARWKKTMVIEANANVSKYGKETRLRISFQRKYLDNNGGIMNVEEIRDPYFYQEFFAKVDQSVFIQDQRI